MTRVTRWLSLLLLPATWAVQAASLPATGTSHGVPVTAQRPAPKIGADILHQGVNVIEAAIAVGHAEAVVNTNERSCAVPHDSAGQA